MDDIAKGGLTFASEIISKGRESFVVNLTFLPYETTKLAPKRITVKSSDANKPPLLAVLSITRVFFK